MNPQCNFHSSVTLESVLCTYGNVHNHSPTVSLLHTILILNQYKAVWVWIISLEPV